jgi:hypothetical protein
MRSAGGVGSSLIVEPRFHYPVRLGGDWRLSFGLPFGWSGCRGQCPSLGWHADQDDSIVTGIFFTIGGTASVGRAVSVGRWLFLPAVGFRASAYYLGATSEYEGARWALLAGPVAGLSVLRTYRDSPPGFTPPPTWRRGVEVTLSALRAEHRSPEGIAWLLGVGWTFVDEQ